MEKNEICKLFEASAQLFWKSFCHSRFYTRATCVSRAFLQFMKWLIPNLGKDKLPYFRTQISTLKKFIFSLTIIYRHRSQTKKVLLNGRIRFFTIQINFWVATFIYTVHNWKGKSVELSKFEWILSFSGFWFILRLFLSFRSGMIYRHPNVKLHLLMFTKPSCKKEFLL